MKVVFLLFVVAVAFAAGQNTHLFDNLLQELMKVLHEVHKHSTSISQDTCKTDCQTQLALSAPMCAELCKRAAEKFHLVESA